MHVVTTLEKGRILLAAGTRSELADTVAIVVRGDDEWDIRERNCLVLRMPILSAMNGVDTIPVRVLQATKGLLPSAQVSRTYSLWSTRAARGLTLYLARRLH